MSAPRRRRSTTCSATRRSRPRASPTSWSPGSTRRSRPAARSQHLVFVIDEMGTFIGDSNERISELNSLAEMIGNKGKGKVWLIVTSQQDLEKVVDRTNFQPALVGRLNARFELKPHLISDEINKVVSERILKKHPSEEAALRGALRGHMRATSPSSPTSRRAATSATVTSGPSSTRTRSCRTRSASPRTSSRRSRASASPAASAR